MLDEVIPEQNRSRRKVAAFPPGKIDVPAAVRGGNRHQSNVLILHILPSLNGNKGNANSGADQLTDGLRAIAFQDNIGVKSGHFSVGIGDAAEIFAFLLADKFLLGDLIEGKGIEVGQGIGDRQRQTDFLFDEGGAIGAGNRLTAGKKR